MRFRAAREADFATCLTLLHSGFVVDAAIKERIVAIWREWLERDQCTFSIIEDPARPHPESIEGCGVSVFVSDRFQRSLTEQPQPMATARLYRACLIGESPVLSRSEVRAANSGHGLNLFVVHFGLRNHDMAAPRTMQALQAGAASFYFFHSGFRIKSLAQEVFGEQQARFMEAGGFRRLIDSGRSSPSSAVQPECPVLFGLGKSDVAPGAVNQLSFLFHPQEPILGLSVTEQQILLHALQNEPDTEIAGSLGVSVDAVKKAWTRIYGRVAGAAPYLIDTDGARKGPHRSIEKRRHLLEYLRNHLEELRPRLPRRRGARGLVANGSRYPLAQ